jgi:hypothetical protein
MIKMTNWSLIDRFKEEDPVNNNLHRPALSGIVQGHPDFEDGTCVSTSIIVGAKGRTIFTQTDDFELVGEPSEEYKKFLNDIGYKMDYNNPILFFDNSSEEKNDE